jgi:hypothetical protein
MKIKLFETQTLAINYVKNKTGFSTVKAREYVNKNLFKTDETNRCWINIDSIV